MIVEDGSIVDGADSYVSVEDADAYATSRGLSTWLALANEAKEPALVRATDYIEQHFGSLWKGRLVSPTQPLTWPRRDVPAREARSNLPFTVIPVWLKRACIELATRTSTGTDLTPDLGRTVVREKVDSIEVDYEAYGRQHTLFTSVELLVQNYLTSSSGDLEMVRG